MLKKTLKWGVIILLAAYVLLVIGRAIYFGFERRTDAQVAKIHATKLTVDDVMGKNLPPDPGEIADDTVEGIDDNKNGIRDDVELAIFKEYPNSAKTRAVLLQYALALQMEVTQPRVNERVAIAAVQEESRAYLCVGTILSKSNIQKYATESDQLRSFVEMKQFNTPKREKARDDFYDNIGSHESLDRKCDIDYSALPN